jgi:hypothetical protein
VLPFYFGVTEYLTAKAALPFPVERICHRRPEQPSPLFISTFSGAYFSHSKGFGF